MQFPLTIIIPTHKRASILRKTLECVGKQSIMSDGTPLEVIVVSDGPDPQTD